MSAAIDQLIINSPYEEPGRYWSYDRQPAASASWMAGVRLDMLVATEKPRTYDDPGIFMNFRWSIRSVPVLRPGERRDV